MILKNPWYKYDPMWVIGDIRIGKNPGFRCETASKKTGHILYEGLTGLSEYIQSEGVPEFKRDIYYTKRRITAQIDKIRAMTEEKDGFRYWETMKIIGGNPDNISPEGMESVVKHAYESLIDESIVPKYMLPDEKIHAFRDFICHLRMTVTGLIRAGIFTETTV